MCGIAGIFELDGKSLVKEETIKAMCDVIVYRGPDDSGAAAGNGFGMGSRRLAIMDLSPRGHMPMYSDDKRHIIVYNGEVYNFADIRDGLVKKGIEFQTGTDTEVILKSYLFYGPECMSQFNGMFAFAIYDTHTGKAFIARDRLGIKPLYYSIQNSKLFIASEMKSFWQAGLYKKFNNDVFPELLSFRYVAGENTVYENIYRLLPGHYMVLENGRINITQWWRLSDYALNGGARPQQDPAAWYKNTFDDSVRLRKISDVPVGVLLSGGLDSSSVAASLASMAAGKVSSFTVRFKEEKYDEGHLAKILAGKYGLDYNELFIDPNEIYAKTCEVLQNNDEPVFHASDLFVKEISGFAKSKVTVLLSGEGGDETLGGYVRYNPLRYKNVLNLAFIFRPFLNMVPVKQNRVKKLIKMLSLGSVDNFILFNSSEILPEDLRRLSLTKDLNISYRKEILRQAKKAYPSDSLRQVMFSDMHTFLCSLLDRNDQMTMRASIECRVPFLDYRIVQGLAALTSKDLFGDGSIKHLLRKSLGDRLPSEILQAAKWGFGVPWHKYYRENSGFRQYLAGISGHTLVKQNFEFPEKITELVNDFLSGDDSGFPIINQLVNICLWYDINFSAAHLEPAAARKTIFYVGNFLARHGKNANFNVSLIQRLQERYHIITSSDKKSKIFRLADMAQALIKARKNVDVVIIDVYSTDAFWYAFVLSKMARMFKIPYINMLHGGNLPKRLKEDKGTSKALFSNAKQNISPSIFLKEVFARDGFEVSYLPNFIEIESYPFKERTKPGFRLFWLRAFHKIYNPVLAVRVLKGLTDKGYDARLCMVGPDKDGSEQDVREAAEKAGVADRLEITGRLSLHEWSRKSEDFDIFINTTNIDNHPVSVIEAMALGMPVISTNVGGLPYLIDNGTDGILIPPDNAEEFIRAIENLVSHPEKAALLAAAARKKVESFTWQVLKEKWWQILG